ncbi:MFS transporter [Streptomyces sp. NPDC001118]
MSGVTKTPAPVATPPREARRLLTGAFVVLGLVMAAWGARMPAVKTAADLGPGRLSIVLLAAAAGMVAGLQIGGRLADRHGPARLLIGPTIAFGCSLALLGQCQTLLTLAAAALVFGVAHGVLDVAVNTSAVAVQLAYGRPIMSGLHAAYSLGALAGAGLAAITTWLPHDQVFAAVGLTTALAAAAAAPHVHVVARVTSTPREHEPQDGARRSTSRTIWLLAGLAAACLLAEGAAADWAAVHLRELGAAESTAAAAYALYSAAMATGRLAGDRLTARFGPATVVRTSALLAAAGLGAGLVAGSAPAALLGWMALGLGLSTTVPSLISAAGRGGPRAVGTVAATGYVGLLAGPALIGALASVTNLTAALALPAVLAAVVAVAAHRALETR